MKTIEVKIKDDHNIVCTVKDENKIEYIPYKFIVEEVKEKSELTNNVSIIDNTITFNNENSRIVIKNYNKNRDITLDSIIERLIEKKKQLRNEYLRRRKITRKNKIITLIILISIATSYVAIEQIQLKQIENEDIKISQEIDKKDILNEENIIVYNDNEQKSVKQNIEIKETEVNINYESRTDTEKYLVAKEKYETLITKYANDYGIDPKIMLAIATQERGIHSSEINGPGVGLMQVERAVWNNEHLTAFNYTKNENETIFVTEEELCDLEYNIKAACMIFQNCLEYSNYNLIAAIQMYNYGYGNIKKAFIYAYGEEIEFKQAVSNEDNSWLEEREHITAGDNMYLEKILSYIEDLDNIKIKNGEKEIHYKVNIKEPIKTL